MNYLDAYTFLKALGFGGPMDRDILFLNTLSRLQITGREIEMQPDLNALKKLVCQRLDNVAASIANNTVTAKEKVMRGEKLTSDYRYEDDDDD